VEYGTCCWAFFSFLMTHLLDLIPVCLSTPNRNCYLGQTAVLVLMEADISFFLWISQLRIFHSGVPALGCCWHFAVAVLYQLLMLPLPRSLCTHSCGIKPGSYLSGIATWFVHAGSEYRVSPPSCCFQATSCCRHAVLTLTFSALLTHRRDPASWPVPGCCQLCCVLPLCRAASQPRLPGLLLTAS